MITVGVKSIKPVGLAPVYNMEVDDTHDFAIESGVIVHNCRYVCMARPINPPKAPVKAQEPYSPLDIYSDEHSYDQYNWYRKY